MQLLRKGKDVKRREAATFCLGSRLFVGGRVRAGWSAQQELLLYNSLLYNSLLYNSRSSCYTTPPGRKPPLLSCSVRSATSIHKSQLPFPPSKASVGFLRLGSKSTKSLGCHQGIETLLWPGLAGEKGGSLQRHSNSGPLCYPRQLKGAVLPKTCRASRFRMGTFLVRSGSQGHVAYFQLPSRKDPVFF